MPLRGEAGFARVSGVARGGESCAGIGGGMGAAGGAVTIHGGKVTTSGGDGAAGIGGGSAGKGGTVTVNGGTVTATDGVKLPEGYTAVEYIESTSGGGQYINTGYTPHKDTKVVCRLLDKGTDTSSAYGSIFGSRRSWSREKSMYFWLRRYGSNVPCYGRAGGEGWHDDKATFPFGDITTVTCRGRTCRWVNDAGTKNGGIELGEDYVESEEEGIAPLVIFALNSSGSSGEEGGCDPTDFWGFRLYSFQIYEGEKLERNFVPCVSATEGAGLYDTAKGKFYPNVGEGQFEVGDVVGGLGGAVTIRGGSVKAEMTENAPSNGVERVFGVAAKVEGLEGLVSLGGLEGYGTNDIYAVEGAVYLWLPNGTYDFTLSDGETTCRYHAVVDGEDIEVDPLPMTVPVTPGVPVVFDTAAEASNALGRAELTPSAEVAAMFGVDAGAKAAYCANFDFAVVATSAGKWAVKAVLTPEAWSNVVESAQAATRQIPVADIAALELNTPTNVTVKACCVPGFYYSVYSGSTVTDLKAVVSDEARNVLCGPGKDVEFSGVVKPSDAAGFFTIGVSESPDVQPTDGHRRLPIIVPPVLPQ